MSKNFRSKRNTHPKPRLKIPYLGKFQLNWCSVCNIPLLGSNECDICHNKGFSVLITPPGDIRPAFKADIESLQSTIDIEYGEGIGSDIISDCKVILLNRIGGLDRTDEVIIDGNIIGIFLFDPLKYCYQFHPNLIGGKYIQYFQHQGKNNLKKNIQINSDALPFILDGKSVLAPGVLNVADDIEENDYCVITTEINSQKKCIAVGISRGNSNELQQMVENHQGFLAKVKDHDKEISLFPEIPIGDQDLIKVFEANKTFLDNKVQNAISFIQTTIYQQNFPVAVGFSGGKDSLGVLLLVWKALGPNFKIFFVNTGLELPEVVENVYNCARSLGMEQDLIIESAGEKFWELIRDFWAPCSRLSLLLSHIKSPTNNKNYQYNL